MSIDYDKKIPKNSTPYSCPVGIGSGCTSLGPNFEGFGKVPIPAKWQKEALRNEQQIAQWWKIFGDPTLNQLVKKAYAQNLDIKSAGLRIVQARVGA